MSRVKTRNKNFTQVSNLLCDLIEQGHIKPIDLNVYVTLNRRGGEDECWLATETIAKQSGCGKRSVNASLARLAEWGFIVIKRRPNTSSVYYVFNNPAEAVDWWLAREFEETPWVVKRIESVRAKGQATPAETVQQLWAQVDANHHPFTEPGSAADALPAEDGSAADAEPESRKRSRCAPEAQQMRSKDTPFTNTENKELSVAADTATTTEPDEATQAAEHFAQQFNTYHARRNGDSVKVKPRWVTDMDRLLRIGGNRSSKAGADVQVDPPQDVEHLKRVITAMFERLTDNTNGRIAWADTISSPSGLRANWGAIRDALNATRQTNTSPIIESAHNDECCGQTPGWVNPQWNNNDPTVMRPCPGITQLETETTTKELTA